MTLPSLIDFLLHACYLEGPYYDCLWCWCLWYLAQIFPHHTIADLNLSPIVLLELFILYTFSEFLTVIKRYINKLNGIFSFYVQITLTLQSSWPINDVCSTYIETNQLICRVDQWTVFFSGILGRWLVNFCKVKWCQWQILLLEII